MIAAWILYCSLCALGLSVAAALVERVLLAGRGPLRLIWSGALALSLLVPALAFRLAPRVITIDNPQTDQRVLLPDAIPATPHTAVPPIVERQRTLVRPDLRATLSRFDQPLLIAWLTLSLAVIINFFGGVVLLAWMRRRWQRHSVLGVSVFVSDRTGPAVVGVVKPSIVLPEWALALQPAQLALLLRHEQEHQRAGDGRLLAAAQLALIAMPWNPALWWQVLRLRAAVELDCDARVLQNGDARSYGDLLLEVARPPRRPSVMGATAFAEHATQLERRIRVLARHRVRTSRAARVLATCVALVALTVAWVTPRPAVPARDQVTPPASTTAPLDAPAATAQVSEKPEPATPQAAPPAAQPPAAEPPVTRADNSNDDSTPTSTTPIAAPPEIEQQSSPLVDTVMSRLFDGITLTPIQRVRIRDLLLKLEQEQVALNTTQLAAALVSQSRVPTLQAQRDSELRALLSSDADRALFDANRSQTGGARGGRGGGQAFDRSLAQRGGGGGDTLSTRGGGGGRGARRGGGGGGRGRGEGGAQLPDSVVASVTNVMNDLTFRRLFAGIQLTADQEAAARALITRTQEEIRVQRTTTFNQPMLRFSPASGEVIMRAESAAALLDLVPNSADRATVQARIVTVPR